MKSDRVPVLIDAATYQRLKSYSELTGVPVAKVAREALADWMDTVGAARMEALTATAGSYINTVTGTETATGANA